MEIKGKLIQLLDKTIGEGKNGRWQKQIFVIETDGKYPKKVALTAWGDLVDRINEFIPGNIITASIDIESREYNGRWYTDVKARKIESNTPKGEPVKDYLQPEADEPDGLTF